MDSLLPSIIFHHDVLLSVPHNACLVKGHDLSPDEPLQSLPTKDFAVTPQDDYQHMRCKNRPNPLHCTIRTVPLVTSASSTTSGAVEMGPIGPSVAVILIRTEILASMAYRIPVKWYGVVLCGIVSYRAIHVQTLGGDCKPHQPCK